MKSRRYGKATKWLALLFALTLVAAACSSDAETDTADEATTTTAAPADEPDEEPAEPVQIAYLSASSANTWLLESRNAMEEIAAANNIEIVEFDA